MGRVTEVTDTIDQVCSILLAGGIIVTSLAAPNAIQLVEPVLKHIDLKNKEREAKRLLYYMKRQNLFELKELPNGKTKIILTSKGKKRAYEFEIESLRIENPRKWDKKWRLVLFDIPEEFKTARNAFSLKLKQLGFYQLQRSVLVHPFPCRAEIEFLKDTYEIDPFVTFIETEEVDKHNLLIRNFANIL